MPMLRAKVGICGKDLATSVPAVIHPSPFKDAMDRFVSSIVPLGPFFWISAESIHPLSRHDP